MRKIFPFLVIVVLLLVAACGGNDSTGEPTSTTEPTTTPPTVETAPTLPPTEPGCNTYYWFDSDSTECGQKEFCGAFMYQGLQTFGTQAECEATLAAMSTPTPPPSTQGADAAEEVLATVMPNLVIAIAEVDGGWQAYAKSGIPPMSTLNKGGAYYFFAAGNITVGKMDIQEGTNNAPAVWMSDTITASTVLSNYEDSVLIAISFDNSTKEWSVYQSPSVTNLAEIQSGQTYHVFEADPARPISASWNSYTR